MLNTNFGTVLRRMVYSHPVITLKPSGRVIKRHLAKLRENDVPEMKGADISP